MSDTEVQEVLAEEVPVEEETMEVAEEEAAAEEVTGGVEINKRGELWQNLRDWCTNYVGLDLVNFFGLPRFAPVCPGNMARFAPVCPGLPRFASVAPVVPKTCPGCPENS